MKAKFIYNLENPEEQKAVNRIVKSTDMAIVLFDIHYNLRKQVESLLGESVYDELTLDVVFTQIENLLDNNGININDLIE